MKSEETPIPTTAKYKIGDYIKTYINMKGTVVLVWYNEELKDWMYRTKDQEFITRENNVRPNKTEPIHNNYMDRKRRNKNNKGSI